MIFNVLKCAIYMLLSPKPPFCKGGFWVFLVWVMVFAKKWGIYPQ